MKLDEVLSSLRLVHDLSKLSLLYLPFFKPSAHVLSGNSNKARTLGSG
jgi:hypothetical protein